MFKRKGLILIVAYLIINVGVIANFEMNHLPQVSAVLVSSILTFGVAVILYYPLLKSEWQRLMSRTRLSTVILRSIGLFFIIGILRSLMIALMGDVIDLESLGQNQQMLEDLQLSTNYLSFFFIAVINAPIVEELIFREAMNGWVNKDNKFLLYLMAIISTYLFASAHAFVPADLLIYLPLAISLYLFYYIYDRNVWASIILHFTNNFIAVMLMFLISSLPPSFQESLGALMIQ